jgi:hypothetical protein
MKKIALAATIMLTFGVAAGSAEAQSRPGGCLKYGVGGAVAGHFAGGHRIKGALTGCALGLYQRRKYERTLKEQNNRNRDAERGRLSNEERANRYEPQDRSAERAPLPRQGRTGPYDDLGLDIGRGRPTGGGQADRSESQTRGSGRGQDGYEPGGSFARGQSRSGNSEGANGSRSPWRYDPENTGSFSRGNGTIY